VCVSVFLFNSLSVVVCSWLSTVWVRVYVSVPVYVLGVCVSGFFLCACVCVTIQLSIFFSVCLFFLCACVCVTVQSTGFVLFCVSVYMSSHLSVFVCVCVCMCLVCLCMYAGTVDFMNVCLSVCMCVCLYVCWYS